MKHKKKNEEAATPGVTAYSRENAQEHYGSKLKKRKVKKGFKALLVCLIVVLAGAIAAVALYMSDVQARLNQGVDDNLLGSLIETPKGDPFYMLLLGVDKSQERADSAEYGESDHNYRSDSIMLARIDPKQEEVTLVSIHRDTLVDLGENGTQKINAAYAIGGPSYAVDVLSEFAGVPISHYAEIDFDQFVGVVDKLGGIEVDVPIDIDDPMAGEPIKKGKQTLNGKQALTLCRSRHAYDEYGDGDLYRAANQRMVIAAIAKKVLQSDPATMTASISELANSVTTDMSLQDILTLAEQMRGIDMDKDVYSGMEPTTSSYVNDTWYEICDTDAWRTMMQRVSKGLSPYASEEDNPVGDAAGAGTNVKNEDGSSGSDFANQSTPTTAEPDEALTGTVQVLNAAAEQGLAGRVANSLSSQGFTASADTAKNLYEDTVVVYFNEANKAKAEAVAKALGGEVQVRDGNGVYADNGYDVLVVLGSDLRNYS